MAYFVGITTYQREEALLALLDQLGAMDEAEGLGLEVHVVDDAPPAGNVASRNSSLPAFDKPGWTYEQHDTNHGRERYWQTYRDHLLQAYEAARADRFVSLPDDCLLAADFFSELDALFGAGARCVNFHRVVGLCGSSAFPCTRRSRVSSSTSIIPRP